MIQSFQHKDLGKFFESGSAAGLQPHHAKRLRMLLVALDTAQSVEDMDVPGFVNGGANPRKSGGEEYSALPRWVGNTLRMC